MRRRSACSIAERAVRPSRPPTGPEDDGGQARNIGSLARGSGGDRMVTEEFVRRLAERKSNEASIVSLYLDVDGRQHPKRQDYEGSLERLLRQARRTASQPVLDDLKRIEDHVHAGIDRSLTRGL